MDPNKVVSPRDKWHTARLLHDGRTGGGHSIALGFWQGEPVIATRWDGEDGALGHPTSFAYAVWFIQPRMFWEGILACGEIFPDDIKFARLFLRLDAAKAA